MTKRNGNIWRLCCMGRAGLSRRHSGPSPRGAGGSMTLAVAYLAVSLLLAVQQSWAEDLKQERPAPWTEATPISASFDFTSEITGRPYRVWAFVPDHPSPPEGFPTLYVLDGNLYFNTVVDIVRLQAPNFIRPAVVVGIGYQTDNVRELLTVRRKDLTTQLDPDGVAALAQLPGASTDPAGLGGLDDFFQVITREVRPKVKMLAETNPQTEVLVGHSLGGMAAVRAAFFDKTPFTAFVASAPSLWWNDFEVLDGTAAFIRRARKASTATKIFLSVGGLEDQIPDVPQFRKLPADARAQMLEGLARVRMVGAVQELGRSLEQAAAQGAQIDVQTLVFANENHASVVPAALSRGIAHVLRQ